MRARLETLAAIGLVTVWLPWIADAASGPQGDVDAEAPSDHQPASVRPGVLPGLPLPISAGQLDQMVSALALSKTKRRVLLSAHEAYKQAFQRLRETYFDKYVESFHLVAKLPRNTPSRDVVVSYSKQYRALQGEIARLDDQLFDAILDLAGDQMRQNVSRWRTDRERAGFMADPMMAKWFVNHTFADVAAVFESLPLDTEVREALRAELQGYTARLTSRLRELHVATLTIREEWAAVVEADERLAVVPDVRVDIQSMRAFQRTASAWAGIVVKAWPVLEKYKALNREEYRKLEPSLPLQLSREFRRRYLSAEYGGVHRSDFSYSVERAFEAATRKEYADEATLHLIRGEYAKYLKKLVPAEEEDIRTLEDEYSGRVPGIPGHRIGLPPPGRPRGLEERQLRREAMAFLRATLGQDIVRELLAEAQTASNLPDPLRATNTVLPTARPKPFQEERLASLHLPRAMERATVEQLFQLNEGQRELLESVYSAYDVAYSQFAENEFREVRRINLGNDRRQRQDGTIRVGVASPDEVRSAYSLVRGAEGAAAEVERKFFAELGSNVLDAGQLARLWRPQLHRTVEFATGREPRRGGLGSREAAISLVAVIDQAYLPPEDVAAPDEVLRAVSGEIMSLLDGLVDARLRAWHAVWMYRAWSDREFAGHEGMRERWGAARDDATQHLIEQWKLLVDRLREAMRMMTNTIAHESAEMLLESYRRAAFPEVFRWRDRIEGLIQGGLEREDHRLPEALAVDLMSERETLCGEMISVHRAWDDSAGSDDEVGQAKLGYQMDQLIFDQGELESRIAAELQQDPE